LPLLIHLRSEEAAYDYNSVEDFNDPQKTSLVNQCLYDKSNNRNIHNEYCTDSNLEFLDGMRNELISVQLPLAFLSFVTFYYGNDLYKMDDKVEIDPFPNMAPADMPQLIEAQTSSMTLVAIQPQIVMPRGEGVTSAPATYAAVPTYSAAPTYASVPSAGGGGTYAALPFAGEAQAMVARPSYTQPGVGGRQYN